MVFWIFFGMYLAGFIATFLAGIAAFLMDVDFLGQPLWAGVLLCFGVALAWPAILLMTLCGR